MDMTPSIGSSLSEIAVQHHLHKERQSRIRKSAFKPPDKQIEPEQLPQIVISPPAPQERYFSVLDVIMKQVTESYGVTPSDILSQRRLGNIVKARHAAIVMLHKFTQWTTFKIALKLNRDPSTVFYVIQKQQKTPEDFCDLEARIKDKLPLVRSYVPMAVQS